MAISSKIMFMPLTSRVKITDILFSGSDLTYHQTKLSNYVYSPKEITRVSVMQGHEDDSLLTFFPNGFICHDGPRIPI
jgi:hypothetical protein